ncbi:USP24 (predicted) [Pycnogonum litorale]
MDVDDEKVTTLMSMGFLDDDEIRRALKLSKNDINEAVALLTREQPGLGYGGGDSDVEMKDIQNFRQLDFADSSKKLEFSSSDASVASNKSQTSCSNQSQSSTSKPHEKSLEFPTTNLYELESRVFTDQWSIPYKKDESLGKCLVSATRLAEEGLCEADENCKRFVDKALPESFKKLLTTLAVRKWNADIQEGIYNMSMLLIDFVVERLRHDPVPIDLLNSCLVTVFDPENQFHSKNRLKEPESDKWDKIFGADGPYAICPSSSDEKDPCGWLVDFINKFGEQGGFEEIQKTLKTQDGDITTQLQSIAALLKPLGICAEYLKAERICPLLSPFMENSVHVIVNLTDNDLKNKTVGYVTDVIYAIKTLCVHLWPQQVDMLDKLRLDVILRMLKCNHFNARMNALKEVTKLVSNARSSYTAKYAIENDKLLDWVAKNEILSIALEGNIDQSQYCDKLKDLVEFIGSELSIDELTKIWSMQKGRNLQVMDNLSVILAAASTKFNNEQFDHLFNLIEKTWEEEDDRMRERLVTLIGKIGKESSGQVTLKVLDLLWSLAHLPSLPKHLIEHALHEHLNILSDSNLKDQKCFVLKCLDDIKKGICVLPAIKHLHNVIKTIVKPGFHKQDKTVLHELNRSHDIIKLLSTSLSKCHKQAAAIATSSMASRQPVCRLTAATVVDKKYTHGEYMRVHLEILQFLLQDGHLYLSWNRAKEIWDTLVTNLDACYYDRELCLEWFTNCLQDLESDTQSNLFHNKLLKMDPVKITKTGFSCFKTYFESVNINDHKIRKSGALMIVEKIDQAVIDFLWRVSLEAQDEEIAEKAIRNILEVSYINLAPRLRKDPVGLHNKFINDCYKKLENLTLRLGAPTMVTAVSSATKTLTAITVSEAATIPIESRATTLRNLKRILLIAIRYIHTIEELYEGPRTILPHGVSFHGHPIILNVSSDNDKNSFRLHCHSNETVWSLRHRIAQKLKKNAELLQLSMSDISILPSKNQNLLTQLNILDGMTISVKSLTSTTVKEVKISAIYDEGDDHSAASHSVNDIVNSDQEKMLPGVVMSNGHQVFETLYQIADLGDSSLADRVQELLCYIPTDSSVIDVLDVIVLKETSKLGGASAASALESSPRSSPRFHKKTAFSFNHTREALPSNRDKLKALFDASSQDMSAFRLLYNLQVLSSKLMPTTNEMGLMEKSNGFCQTLLKAGILKVIASILNSDCMPAEADKNIRQSSYYIALQIARFLLCGKSVIDTDESNKCLAPSQEASSSASAIVYTPSQPFIQSLTPEEFKDTVTGLVRVSWAATAGKLHLASNIYPIKDGSTYHGRKSRQSSSGSANSTESDGDNPTLHGGLCIQKAPVSNMDSLIAQESLQLLFTCLEDRPELIGTFYNVRCIRDFIIDVLLGSPNPEIRCKMRDLLYSLTNFRNAQFKKSKEIKFSSPRQFVMHVLLTAHLPLWVPSSNTRGTNQRLLSQCNEYFDLRCKLLANLSAMEQSMYEVNLSQMIDDEVAWVQNFTLSNNSSLQDSDNALLSGHLFLIRSLLTGENVNKTKIGNLLIPDLIDNYLFPASRMISDGDIDKGIVGGSTSYTRCVQKESRIAVYDVLLELAKLNVENLTLIVSRLIKMHHYFNLELSNEFEYEPAVVGHSESGLVGLKNAGATCYMNSVMQQLYMQPRVREAILSVDTEERDEENVFYQFQVVFGHLMESKLQYHAPENFWKCFKLWGLPVNVREQQDAFEFFTHLVDQVDEYLKSINRDAIFKYVYEGMFIDQKLCQDCEHRYEREEPFIALNLTVKTNSLQESLDQFVKGELLEGDNSYFCEKCSEKRRTIKRMCIKTLPPVLVVQLKRFGYDWEENRALKFDDCFKFPWTLDMYPYTATGIHEIETGVKPDISKDVVSSPSPKVSNSQVMSTLYELVGIVVHSGQANAGHYYSFIKERRGDSISNANKGKWFKFNDTTVEEIEMNESTLEVECFGGSYKAKVSEHSPSPSFPETRVRYWNTYMLFYERKDELIRTPLTPRKMSTSRLSSRKSTTTPRKSTPTRARTDSLTQLTQLVHHGERQGLFSDKMPARIQRIIKTENLHFMQNRDVYNDEYISFVKKLVFSASEQSSSGDILLQALRLAVNFLLNTYLHMKSRDKNTVDEWLNTINSILTRSKEASYWLIEYLAADNGSTCSKLYLLECSSRDVRQSYVSLMEKAFSSYFVHSNNQINEYVDRVINKLLQLLDTDVSDKCKTCSEFFSVLSYYVQLGTTTCTHILKQDGFSKMITFLLGSDVYNEESVSTTARRWSSLQTREFSALHSTIATVIFNCDLGQQRTCEPESFIECTPEQWMPVKDRIELPVEVQNILVGTASSRYIREVVCACREIPGCISTLVNLLLYCSFCNEVFSMNLLQQITAQYTMVPSNELKGIFQLLHELLLMEDPLQFHRIQCIIDGFCVNETNYDGMLATIQNNHESDSRQSYQCIKILVGLAHKCSIAKEYLLQNPSSWQWAVTWLKKKMTEHTTALWNNSPNTLPLSNEDSNTKSFQRTISAQDTLAEATALLTELESPDGKLDMEIDNESTDAFVITSSEDSVLPSVSDDFFESVDS